MTGMSNEDRLSFLKNSIKSYQHIFSLRNEVALALTPLLNEDDEYPLPLQNNLTFNIGRYLWGKNRIEEIVPEKDMENILKALATENQPVPKRIIFLPLVDRTPEREFFSSGGHLTPIQARTALAANLAPYKEGYETTAYAITYLCSYVAQRRVFLQEQAILLSQHPKGKEIVKQNIDKEEPLTKKIIIDKKTLDTFADFIHPQFFDLMMFLYKIFIVYIIQSTKIKDLLDKDEILVSDVINEIDKKIKNKEDASLFQKFCIIDIFTIPAVINAMKVTTASSIVFGIKQNAKDILEGCFNKKTGREM